MKRHIAAIAVAGALSAAGINLADAQEMYVGEVRNFGFNWCPIGWLQAAGQLLPIQQYTPLFALIGTTYGGNGSTNFALPNLSGRAPYGQLNNGQGQPIGAVYGTSQVTLTIANLPAHTHQLYGSSAADRGGQGFGHVAAADRDLRRGSRRPGNQAGERNLARDRKPGNTIEFHTAAL